MLSTQPAAMGNDKAEGDELLPSEDVIVAEKKQIGIEIIQETDTEWREKLREEEEHSRKCSCFPLLREKCRQKFGILYSLNGNRHVCEFSQPKKALFCQAVSAH